MSRSMTILLAAALAGLGAAQAQSPRGGSLLEQFEGEFRGKGTLVRDNDATDLTCTLRGQTQGEQLSLRGTCRANIFASANISIQIRRAGDRYVGQFRDGLGTVSRLSGEGSGNGLTFIATETEESVRPDPPARMQLSRAGGALILNVRNTVPGEGSAISLNLAERI